MTKIQLKNIVKEALNSLKEQSQVFPQACADPVYYYQATQGITQVPLVNPAQLVSTSYVQDALAACCNNPSDPNCLTNNTNLIVQNNCCNYIDACAEFGSLSQSNQNACCEKCQATLPILPSDPCYQYCKCCERTPPVEEVKCSCCDKFGMPVSMQQMVPSNPGCIGAENTYYAGLGVTDCALSQVSGGPGPKCKKPSSINPDVVSVMVERFQKLANIKK